MNIHIAASGGVIGTASFGHNDGVNFQLRHCNGIITDVTVLETGLYRVVFSEDQPDENFVVPEPCTSTPGIRPTLKKGSGSVVLDFRDLDGDAKNVREVQLAILRLSEFSATAGG